MLQNRLFVFAVWLIAVSSISAKSIDSIQIWHDKYQVKVPRVLSHRGFYNYQNTTQNSRASLRNAIKLGAEGSEMDIWLTSDNILVVNHDAKRDGLVIEKSTWKEVKKLRLDNGERLPRFKDFLKILKSSNYTHLLVEVKRHSTKERTVEAALAAMQAVEKAGLSKMVEYLSFSLPACKALAQRDPSARVFYLGGDKSPRELYDMGINAMNCKASVYRKNPSWIKEAHELGMSVTARGMNTKKNIQEMIQLGVDNLATDFPVQAMDVRELMVRNKK